MTEDTNNEMPPIYEDTSTRIDAVNSILSILKCPAQVRNLIHVLIGISEGHIEFETFHKEIASKMNRKGDVRADDNSLKAVQRAHQTLIKWQTENGLNLVEYVPGYRLKEGEEYKFIPSHYYLHIQKMADEVIALANTIQDIDRSKKLLRAARRLLHAYSPAPVYNHEKYHPPQNKEVEKNLKLAKTFIRKAIDICERESYFIFLSSDTVDELEDAINKLRRNPLDYFKSSPKQDEGEGGGQ